MSRMPTSFTTSKFESPTGATIAVYQIKAKIPAKAVVHINHGMAEHSARYERFANVLAENGYHTIAHDHRGHGHTTAPDAPLGMFSNADGWQKSLADVDAVIDMACENFPDLPIIYFGHSMGSIIGLNYCIKHSIKIDAAALWNSGVDSGILLTAYSFLLGLERLLKGSDVPSQIARKLAFEDWNKKFKPNRTESDWLTRDEAEVDKYIADPLCGFDASNSLWSDLLEGIQTGGDDRELAKIRNDLPMHLQAGGKDPCSDNGRAVERVAIRLQRTGIKDLTQVLHADNRHESLNELNRDDVMRDFLGWLDERFAG